MSMTESEALQWFKGFYNGDCERKDFEDTICADCNFPCRHGLPILRAISALEEIQQYKAIGTVSEFRENKNFLEFLCNAILPNEMEQYLAMYHASGEKGE
jgi:hypothetical protein